MDSFRSTLDEAREADLLLHVVDAGIHDLHERIQVVDEVLEHIGCSDIPQLLVFNKIDMVDERRRHEILGLGKGRMVSCASLEGIHELKEAVASLLLRRVARGSYVIPFQTPERELTSMRRPSS